MKKILAITLAFIGFGAAVNAQTLLYQWAFTNSSDTASNSAASYTFTPGTGDLTIRNLTGNVFAAGLGFDGINPLVYFTNSTVGPGSGPGVIALGAFVANGQGYNGGNSAVALATNLNLGNVYKFTMTFWFRLDPPFASGTLSRFVDFGALLDYDSGGKGSGNNNGTGSALNSPFSQNIQNGVDANPNPANASQVNPSMSVLTAFPSGLVNDGGTWYFEAVTYDGSLTSSNFFTWIGSTNQSPQIVGTAANFNANFGAIPFTTNATVKIGNDFSTVAPRGLTFGAVADVRFYKGIVVSNDLEKIRNFQVPDLTNLDLTSPATVTSQPNSGNSYVGSARTFTVGANGNPAIFTYLWRSNGVAVTGGTNSGLTLTNLQLAANTASFVCSVSNTIGGTNSTVATVAVLTAPASNTYLGAIFTNNPFALWRINEPSNGTPVAVYDYIGGRDGVALDPTNMLFVGGPASPIYSGFPAHNSAIQENTATATIPSRLNLGSPGTYTNTGMTICGWVKTTGISTPANYGLIYNTVSDTGGGFGLVFDANGNNELSYQWGQNLPTFFSTSGLNVPVNEWTFVALVISTNLSQTDIANSITANTNATVYVGARSLGLLSARDDTASTGDVINNGANINIIACGRSMPTSSENGSFYAGNPGQFSSVAVFYTALSPNTITNLFLIGAQGVALSGIPDPSIPGNLLLTYPLGGLQSAPVVQGPYTPVLDGNSIPVVSPFSVPMTNQHSFFRVSP